MSAVYGAQVGLSLVEISTFVAAFYIGAVVLQYPLGWMSDRMDRRLLIMSVAAVGGVGAVIGIVLGVTFPMLLVSAFIIGGMTSPLYSLLIAYTNDYLEYDDMSAASGGLVFINGLGAIAGPIITGWLMGSGVIGPWGFFLFIAVLMFIMALYAAYRMTQRVYAPVDETGTIASLYPTSSLVALEVAQEVAIEAAQDEQDAQELT